MACFIEVNLYFYSENSMLCLDFYFILFYDGFSF